jgi:hypothetical protein
MMGSVRGYGVLGVRRGHPCMAGHCVNATFVITPRGETRGVIDAFDC